MKGKASKRAGAASKPRKARSTREARKKRARRGTDTALLDRLVQAATAVRDHAYAPYSKYRVGAAIATRSGEVFVGCNVENASYGATICAERGAIMAMVAAGERDPIACAVVTRDGGSPCGMCRQVLAEHAHDMPVAMVAAEDPYGETGRVVTLAELLPLAFRMR